LIKAEDLTVLNEKNYTLPRECFNTRNYSINSANEGLHE